jgi:3-hydroxyisobutyrate dehydrogenase-like beta-hydroxyacid dehydrogenase
MVMAMAKERGPIGIIGLGIMGGAFARNLVASGWRVVGYDVSGERCTEMARDGVEIAANAADAARAASVVMTSLPNVKALDAVAAELADAKLDPRIVLEMSTFPLDDKQRFERTLAAAGHKVIDCPVSGTGAQAAVKDPVLYPSGDSAVIASLGDLFAGFTRGAYDCGAYGNGSRMKFIANHLVAIHNVATAEAMIMAEKAGLDLDTVVRCIGDGAGSSRMLQMRGPLMAAERYIPATMKMVNWMKDMDAIGGFARSLGTPTPLFDATRPIYEQAMAEGRDEQDTAAVFSVMGGTGGKQ